MSTVAAPRTVCVLGFHRSGTSLTARVVNLLGVHLGEDLLPAHETDNPQGYWEPRWMNELNDELLATFGTAWCEPFSAPPSWEQSDRLAALRKRAQDLVAQQLGEATPRGVKDPRLSLTLPFWRPLLGDVSCVICVRSPIDAIASLQRRPEPTLSVRAWGELWLEYTARALYETRGLRRMLVFYEDYFDDPEAVVTRLASFLGVADQARPSRVQRAVAEVSGELRRHLTSARELAADPGVPAAARMLYLALRAARDTPEELRDAIERVAPDLWWTSRDAAAYEHTVAELTAARAELEAAQTDLTARAAELEAVRERTLERENELARAHADVAGIGAELERLRASRSWRVTAPLRTAARRVRERIGP